MRSIVVIVGMSLLLSLTVFAQKKQVNSYSLEVKAKVIGSDFVELSLNSKGEFAILISSESLGERKYYLKNLKTILPTDTASFKNLPLIMRNCRLLSYTNANLNRLVVLKDLSPKTDYWVYGLKKDRDSFAISYQLNFNTLAEKPTRQAKMIAFDDVTDTSFVVSWVNGSGEGRILVVAKGEKFDKPENGKEYKASNAFGKGDLIKGTTSVVYDGKDLRPKVKVTGLEPGTKYAVGVFEYNGNGKYRHYNIASESNNPRVKATRIPAPIILNATPLEEGVYQIKWKKSKGAITYILDLARDKEFKQIVEPYKDLDIGDLESYEISDLERNAKYYIRLKAKGEFGESLYSPVFELKTK